jgi:hypothetical protein
MISMSIMVVDMLYSLIYKIAMPKRQKKANPKVEVLLVRMTPGEKQAFQDAALLAGIPLSAWMRERLRREARKELEEAGQKIAFLQYPER